MSAVPAFLLNVEEEEADDLAALGADLNRPMSESEIDAAMSEMLRRMAWYDKQIATTNEAEALERERINARYERRREPLRKRRAEIEAQALALAERATFEGKKKSRNVGNGTFGKKTEPERVKIIDANKAMEFALINCPDAIREKIAVSVEHKAVAPVVLARLHETGELPDGFEHSAEHDTYYVRPEVD